MSKKEIWLNANFNADTVKTVRDSIIDLSNKDRQTPIIVYINSYGGSVDALNLLIDTFNEVPNEIITVCLGTAMSAGATLLSCGDKRFVGKNARIMIHEVSSWLAGTTTELKQSLDETNRMNRQLLKIIAKNSGKTLKDLKKIFKDTPDFYLTASEAVKFGIADYIGVPSILETTAYHIVIDNKKLLTNEVKKKKIYKKEKKR